MFAAAQAAKKHEMRVYHRFAKFAAAQAAKKFAHTATASLAGFAAAQAAKKVGREASDQRSALLGGHPSEGARVLVLCAGRADLEHPSSVYYRPSVHFTAHRPLDEIRAGGGVVVDRG